MTFILKYIFFISETKQNTNMRKTIIKLNERIVKSIFSLNEVMVKNQRFPNLNQDFIKECSRWYYCEGDNISLTLDLIGLLCHFSRSINANKKAFYILTDVANTLKGIKKYEKFDFKEMDKIEKAVLPLIKDFSSTGVITHVI